MYHALLIFCAHAGTHTCIHAQHICVKTAQKKKKMYKKGERRGKVLNVNKMAEDRKKHAANTSQCHRSLPLHIQKERKNDSQESIIKLTQLLKYLIVTHSIFFLIVILFNMLQLGEFMITVQQTVSGITCCFCKATHNN